MPKVSKRVSALPTATNKSEYPSVQLHHARSNTPQLLWDKTWCSTLGKHCCISTVQLRRQNKKSISMAFPPTQGLTTGRHRPASLSRHIRQRSLRSNKTATSAYRQQNLRANKTATGAYLCATADPVPNANPCAMVDAMPASMPPPPLFCWAGGWAAGRGAGGAL